MRCLLTANSRLSPQPWRSQRLPRSHRPLRIGYRHARHAARSPGEGERQRKVRPRRGGPRHGLRHHQARPDDGRHFEDHARGSAWGQCRRAAGQCLRARLLAPGANTWALMEAAKEIGGNIWNTPTNAALLDSTVFQNQAMNAGSRRSVHRRRRSASGCRLRQCYAGHREDLHAALPGARLHGSAELHGAHTPPGRAQTCEIWAPTQARQFRPNHAMRRSPVSRSADHRPHDVDGRRARAQVRAGLRHQAIRSRMASGGR